MNMYSLSTLIFHGLSLDETIAGIARSGFSCVELSSEEYADEFIRNPGKIRRRLEQEGVRPWSVHSPSQGWDNGTSNDAERKKSVEAAAVCFGPAAEVGAEIVICHPDASKKMTTKQQYKDCKAFSRQSLEIIADHAKKTGIKIALENMPARNKLRPSSSVSELLEMIDGLGDHVGICIDAGHSNANGLIAAEDARLAGEKLFAVHIQDNDGKGEDQHLLPGLGTTDWDRFLNTLDEIGFTGPRIFELSHTEEDLDVTLAKVGHLHKKWKSYSYK